MSIFGMFHRLRQKLAVEDHRLSKDMGRLEELRTLMFYWMEIENDARTRLGIAGTPVERGEVELQIREASANHEMYRREFNEIKDRWSMTDVPPWE